MIETWTFIFFISRQSGALIERMIMTVKHVFMHIIGKTTAENHQCLHTVKRCANLGRLIISLHHIKTGVTYITIVPTLTGGKSKNTIQTSLKLKNASTEQIARKLIAHITTARLTEELLWILCLCIFPNQEPKLFQPIGTSTLTALLTIWCQINRPVSREWPLRLFATKSNCEEGPKPPLSRTILKAWVCENFKLLKFLHKEGFQTVNQAVSLWWRLSSNSLEIFLGFLSFRIFSSSELKLMFIPIKINWISTICS